MIETLQKSTFKNGYLLITAAWLYTLSFIFINYWSYTSSPSRVKLQFEKYIVNNEKEIEAFSSDGALLQAIANGRLGNQYTLWLTPDRPKLFVYTQTSYSNPQLRYWNTQQVVPQPRDFDRPDGKHFVVYPNGEFELVKESFFLDGQQVIIIGLVPLRWNYFVETKYLKTNFPGIPGLSDRFILAGSNAAIVVRNGDGKPLFGLQPKENISKPPTDIYSLVLRLASLVFVLIFFHVVAGELSKKQRPLAGFVFLVVVITALRAVSYYLPIPFTYHKFELFDSIVYASNYLHPSLGDLLVNTILIYWFIIFFKLNCVGIVQQIKPVKTTLAWVAGAMLAIVLIAMSFATAGVVRSLIVDAKISFNISNFFGLTVYTFISFFILCFLTLSFFNLSHLVIILFYKLVNLPPWGKYLLVALLGLFYLSVFFKNNYIESNLFVLGWLLLYLFIVEQRPADLLKPLLRSSFFLVWIIFFTSSISLLIIYQNQAQELLIRKRKAEDLAMQTNPSGQNILSIGVLSFTNAFLADNFEKLTSQVSNRNFKDSLLSEGFSGYMNKYDTHIYTFNKKFEPLFNDDLISYNLLTNIILNQSKLTDVAGLYYHEADFDSYSYIFQNDIKDYNGNIRGYFFLVVNPKRFQSEALSPELFRQVRESNNEQANGYSYAVYQKGKLITNRGDYNFINQLPAGKKILGDVELVKSASYSQMWYNAGNNKLILYIKEGNILFELVTLFAYLFGTFLAIMICILVSGFLLKTRFRWQLIKQSLRLTIRNQILTTILFISVFSFLVIGVSTISFYIARYEKNKKERLSNAIHTLAKEIKQQVSTNQVFDDVVKIYDEGASSQLQLSIKEISEIHDVDVNFYDLLGRLRVSTQAYVYDKQVLNNLMDPVAYYRLHYKHEIQVMQNEHLGAFSYVSIYMPVMDDNDEPYAYINIPNLDSQSSLNKEISNFLVTLINLNALIFVLASLIAVLLTNRITRSFSLIGSKMRDVNLGKVNEAITWNKKDEIGVLVLEYNKMVSKLEQSAQALAKTEREGAWREMARQVAHEIKNPLTPMKLSLQYLQRSIHDNKPGIEQLSQKVAATLVEQIDQLAKIASDFSQYANIDYANNAVFDVREVITSLMNLYGNNEQVNFVWHMPGQPVLIVADKAQIARLFTNLLQNAIEATGNGVKPVIVVVMEVQTNAVLTSVGDNGEGILPSMYDKIFTPNFTTKSSGTGLGLAISKGIVEKAGGTILFKTEEGCGTTFFVKFPLAKTAMFQTPDD